MISAAILSLEDLFCKSLIHLKYSLDIFLCFSSLVSSSKPIFLRYFILTLLKYSSIYGISFS